MFETVVNIVTDFSVCSQVTFNFKLLADKMTALPLFEGASILWIELMTTSVNLRFTYLIKKSENKREKVQISAISRQ